MPAAWRKQNRTEAFWGSTCKVSRAMLYDTRNFFRVSRRTRWKCWVPLCRGKERGKRNSTGWPRDGIILEGFFRTCFPHVYFLASRWHDKRLWDVRRGSPCRRWGNGHVKNGKLNRRRINSWPKINALYVHRVGSTSFLMKERPAFRTCTRVTMLGCATFASDSRRDWIRARKARRSNR